MRSQASPVTRAVQPACALGATRKVKATRCRRVEGPCPELIELDRRPKLPLSFVPGWRWVIVAGAGVERRDARRPSRWRREARCARRRAACRHPRDGARCRRGRPARPHCRTNLSGSITSPGKPSFGGCRRWLATGVRPQPSNEDAPSANEGRSRPQFSRAIERAVTQSPTIRRRSRPTSWRGPGGARLSSA